MAADVPWHTGSASELTGRLVTAALHTLTTPPTEDQSPVGTIDVRITAMKKRMALSSAACAAVLAVLPLAGTASAAEYTVTHTSGPHTGDKCTWKTSCAGSASFVHDGDHLLVWDNTGDGHSVVVEYERSDVGGSDYIRDWNHYGKYSRLDINMDIPEDGWITYRVCLGEYGSRSVLRDTCSSFFWESAG